MKNNDSVTGREQFFAEHELIVSKTDLKGHLIYVNDVFCRIAGYTEQECLGQPHSMIRHPHMPRCIFHLLWETIQKGEEIFAYVMNRCANGDHYWVIAHVTPSLDSSGRCIGYHSNRRVPNKSILHGTIQPLYQNLLNEEKRHASRRDGMIAASAMISDMLSEQNVPYDEYIAKLAA